MAIIDSTAVFHEGPLATETHSRTVPLTALRLPGRMEPIPFRLSVTEAFDPAELDTLTITLQEADSDDDWTDVPDAALTIPGTALTAAARVGWRHLPQGVRKSRLRLHLVPTPQVSQSVSKGRLFAALTREEDLPYEPALQVK